MLDLAEAFTKSPCIKWDVHGFCYNKVLNKFDDQVFKLLEIGIFAGHSLVVWHECFPKALIYGIDHLIPEGLDLSFATRLYRGDQSYEPFMSFVASDVGPLDVCIDDGGHYADDQQVSFKCMWPMIKTGGLYIIEDLHQAQAKTIDGFPCTLDFLDALDVRKEYYVGVNNFEKDICVLYKE